MLSSLGPARNVQILPPAPAFSVILLADDELTSMGTPARLDDGHQGQGDRAAHRAAHGDQVAVFQHPPDAVDAFGRVAGIVLDIQLQRGAPAPAGGVDLLDRQFGAPAVMLALEGRAAGQRRGNADDDGWAMAPDAARVAASVAARASCLLAFICLPLVVRVSETAANQSRKPDGWQQGEASMKVISFANLLAGDRGGPGGPAVG